MTATQAHDEATRRGRPWLRLLVVLLILGVIGACVFVAAYGFSAASWYPNRDAVEHTDVEISRHNLLPNDILGGLPIPPEITCCCEGWEGLRLTISNQMESPDNPTDVGVWYRGRGWEPSERCPRSTGTCLGERHSVLHLGFINIRHAIGGLFKVFRNGKGRDLLLETWSTATWAGRLFFGADAFGQKIENGVAVFAVEFVDGHWLLQIVKIQIVFLS